MPSTDPPGTDRLARLNALHLHGMATAWRHPGNRQRLLPLQTAAETGETSLTRGFTEASRFAGRSGHRLHQPFGRVTRHGISGPDARTTTPRRPRRHPRRAIRGLQGAAQGKRRGCTGEAASGYPIPSARRPAQPAATVGGRGADAGRSAGPVGGVAGQTARQPRRQRDGGSARCRAGAARSRRRSTGGRGAEGLRTGLTTLIGGVHPGASRPAWTRQSIPAGRPIKWKLLDAVTWKLFNAD